MPWKKGQSGNPNGAVRKPEIELFRQAIAKVEKEQNKSLLEHAVKKAFESENVLIALMKKILPDLTEDKALREAVRTFLIRPKQ